MTDQSCSPDIERAAFIEAHRHLDLTEMSDAWGRPMFSHAFIEAMWSGWKARASQPATPTGGEAWSMEKALTDEDAAKVDAFLSGEPARSSAATEDAARITDSTCYVERSMVRIGVMGTGDEALLKYVDSLPIFVAADFAAPAQQPSIGLTDIERLIVDYFEAQPSAMCFEQNGEWFVDPNEDTISLTSLAVEVLQKMGAAISSTDQLTAAPLDPETPTCSICGARVFYPCQTLESAKRCQLPPGTPFSSPHGASHD